MPVGTRKNDKDKSDKGKTSDSATSDDTDAEGQLEKIFSELRAINKRLEKLDSLELNINTIDKDLKEVKTSQEFISAEFELQKEQIKKMEGNIENLNLNNVYLSDRIAELENESLNQGQQYADLEQYGRREMVEIVGIPRRSYEKTDDIVLKIAEMAEVTLNLDDIEISHRTSSHE